MYLSSLGNAIYEAKLLIVGEGEAGKTTLARRIENPNCPLPALNEVTEGIGVKTWHSTLEKLTWHLVGNSWAKVVSSLPPPRDTGMLSKTLITASSDTSLSRMKE